MAGTISVNEFQWALANRMETLQREFLLKTFHMPIALLLVIDEENGGDSTGKELARRFNLLDRESKSFIDFYFLGWDLRDENDRSRGIAFNLDNYVACRD